MARDEDDDLYDEEFDFVDDDDEVDDLDDDDEEAVADDSELSDDPADEAAADDDLAEDEEEVVDEYGRPEPVANYVVHVYEHKKFKRTLERPFTPEDAEAFASEYNRTSKSYGRFAVTGKSDAKPKKTLD